MRRRPTPARFPGCFAELFVTIARLRAGDGKGIAGVRGVASLSHVRGYAASARGGDAEHEDTIVRVIPRETGVSALSPRASVPQFSLVPP